MSVCSQEIDAALIVLSDWEGLKTEVKRVCGGVLIEKEMGIFSLSILVAYRLSMILIFLEPPSNAG